MPGSRLCQRGLPPRVGNDVLLRAGAATGTIGAVCCSETTLPALPGLALPSAGSSVLAGDFANADEANNIRLAASRKRVMAALARGVCLV